MDSLSDKHTPIRFRYIIDGTLHSSLQPFHRLIEKNPQSFSCRCRQNQFSFSRIMNEVKMIFAFSSLYTLYLSILFAFQRSNINLEYLLFYSFSHAVHFLFVLGLNTPNSDIRQVFIFFLLQMPLLLFILTPLFFQMYSFLFVSIPYIFLRTLSLISFIYF